MASSRQILIVDDDRDLRDLLTICLQDQSLGILTAADGFSAFTIIEEQQPEVIILDIFMPGMDGLTFLRTLQQEGCIKIPVIVASAHEQIEEHIGSLNIVGFLPKPFDLAELEALIQTALEWEPCEQEPARNASGAHDEPALKTA